MRPRWLRPHRLAQLLLWLLPIPLTTCMRVKAQAERRPNLVIILADDMGYGDPGCYNPDSGISTPAIDRLAREGMRFTDAHAPGAWCVPTRFGLMTGCYPARVGSFPVGERPMIEAHRLTLPGLLRGAGYTTAMVGKWHLGFEGGANTNGEDLVGGPLDRGFERFFGIHASLDIPPYYFIEGRTPVAPPTGTVEASSTPGWTNIQGAFWREGRQAPGFDHAEVHPRFEAEALEFLEQQAGAERPFFLYLALASPHTPWLPDPAFQGTSEAGLYGDFVAQVDATVGKIQQALERTGQAENTLVVFTSDNGPVWYPTDVERFGHSSTGPFRGMKSDAWEGGHRMPFVVRWPAGVPAGTRSDQLICLTDLLATAAELAGVAVEPGVTLDSHSLVPVLRHPESSTTRGATVLKADASVIREGRWKLITHLGSGGFSRPRRVEPREGDPLGQLYDLESDPGEARNLWKEKPEIVERLSSLLEPFR